MRRLVLSFTGMLALLSACSLLTPLDDLGGAGDSGAPDTSSLDAPGEGSAAPGFTVSAPPSLTLQQGGSAPVTVNVTRTGGFTGAVAFTVSGLPAGATANPLTITTDSSSGNLTLALSSSTPQGISHLSFDGLAGSGALSGSAKMDLVVRGPAGSLDALYGNGGVVANFLTTTNFGRFDAATLDAKDDVLLAVESVLAGGKNLRRAPHARRRARHHVRRRAYVTSSAPLAE